MNAYSFKDVSASITGPSGSFNLGYGAAVADEGISIDMAGDKNSMVIGADGRPMMSLHADRSGHVTVRLLKTSPVNSQLMAAYDMQSSSSSLWAQNVIVIRHVVSGDITTCTTVAFKKKPNLAYAKDGNIVDWTFDCGHVDTVLGTF